MVVLAPSLRLLVRLAAAVLLLACLPARADDAAKPDLAVAEPPPAAETEPSAPPSNRPLAILEGPLGVNLVMNVGGRVLKGGDTYDSTLQTIWDNLTGEWEYDPNDFRTNQYAHPYQGSFYMTAGRSLGLGFWESAAYTGLGSFVWEIAGEIHPPSVNDQITTTVAGAFLGEVLFRLSSDILDGGGEEPGFWRELGAGATAPMNGLNRLLFGNRYRDRRVRPTGVSGELGFGYSLGGEDDSTGEPRDVEAGNVQLIARIVHGLPTEEGWRFRRPFDHFDVMTSVYLDRNTFTDRSGVNLLIRGMLVAADPYGRGVSSGLWGLWGVYDVITTGELRASSSAVGFGTVGQLAPSSRVRLQGTAYVGVGFGAAGTNVLVEDKRDYHFGAQTLGLLDLKVLWADRIRVRASVREYVTDDTLSPDQGGFEDLTYALADLTFRVSGRHAFGLEVIGARRYARYPDVPDTSQTFRQFGLTYAYVSEPSMGAGRSLSW